MAVGQEEPLTYGWQWYQSCTVTASLLSLFCGLILAGLCLGFSASYSFLEPHMSACPFTAFAQLSLPHSQSPVMHNVTRIKVNCILS